MRHPATHCLVALLVAVAGILTLVPPPTAAASGRCSVRAPQRVVVDSPSQRIRARLAGDCASAGVSYASWSVVHPIEGLQEVYIFDADHGSDVWRFPAWQRKGRFTLDPSAAYASSAGTVRQNRAAIDVRYASRITLGTRRNGRLLILRAHATRYTSATSRFRAVRDRRAFFSTRDCRTCSWRRIGAVLTGRFGRAELRLRTTGPRDYRAVIRGTTSVWGRNSAVVRR